jgi:hypothetical protein
VALPCTSAALAIVFSGTLVGAASRRSPARLTGGQPFEAGLPVLLGGPVAREGNPATYCGISTMHPRVNDLGRSLRRAPFIQRGSPDIKLSAVLIY